MKNFKIALAATFTVVLGLALMGSPTFAAGAGPDTLTITDPAPPATYEVGQNLSVLININEDGGEVFPASLQVSPNGTDSWTDVPGQTGKVTNQYGRYTFTYAPTGDQYLRATWTQSGTLRETTHLHLTPIVPVPQTGVLNDPTNNGKNWTADFTPGQSGKATQLQVQQIYTDETNEVNATNPTASKTKKMGPWKTIATANQNSSGHVVFPTLASPYPWRVVHKYRAVSGAAKTCDPADNADTTCKTFGIANPTTYDTGLSKLYFNANEGHAIDTRTRYYEGEFSMTADTKGLGCGDVAPTKFSVMKGRGNYSWSFKRKSYTLKLGSSTDLCGMGKSKKYALVSQDYDKSFLRNALAGYIGKKFNNMAWTPDSKPVDLYLNGKYLGNYLLIERIAIDPLRVNVPELKSDSTNITGGYILEWDFRKGADFNVTAGSSGYVGIKEPEIDRDRDGNNTGKGITSAQRNYIDDYLGDADNALKTPSNHNWEDFIDKASAVDYYIAMEYMKPVDGNMWASVYMYKQVDGKLFFGPLWDFDLAAGSANRAGNVVSSSGFYLRNSLGVSAMQTSKTWFNRLNEDPSFRSAVRARWNDIKDSINTNSFLDTQAGIISSSANRSFSSSPSSHSYRISKYQIIKGSWSSDVSYLKGWASGRKSWLGSNF